MLNNHLSFTVLWDREPVKGDARIVGFGVAPFSVKHSYDGPWLRPGASKMRRSRIHVSLTRHRPSLLQPQCASGLLTPLAAAQDEQYGLANT